MIENFNYQEKTAYNASKLEQIRIIMGPIWRIHDSNYQHQRFKGEKETDKI